MYRRRYRRYSRSGYTPRRGAYRRGTQRGPKGKWEQVYTYASKALRIANFAKSMLNTEVKYHDTQLAGTYGPGATFNLSNIAVGDTNTTRDGNSILVKKLNVKYTLTKNSLAPTDFVRVMFYVDHQSRGSKATVTDVLQGDSIDAFMNRDHTARYRILANDVFALNDNTPNVYVDRNFDLSHKIKYDGTANTEADLDSGGVYVLITSKDPTNIGTVDLDSRLRFIDN